MILQPAVSETSRAEGSSMGRVVRHGACLAMVALIAAAAVAPIATAQSPPLLFTPTGAEQSDVVPADVSLVSIEAIGARGGGACGGGTGGLGAHATAELAVSPGSVLYVEVGADWGTRRGSAGHLCQ